ncbi:MAG TPA: carboxypeptidase-like regulatory domain-containing protein, partial [Candidatus Acidoferrales bacterium]|nr:carboxypeptidase-like regulatory domain-containing protein [Candidatus Acidoferrales bacterium]
MNQKLVAVTLLLLVASAVITVPLETLAASSYEVAIIELSSPNGANGDTIRLIGTITTSGGAYEVFIDKTLVAHGNAAGNNIETNFTVPALPAATYFLIIRDVIINVNSTYHFEITKGYSITALPNIIQEGGSTTITVSANGVPQGIVYGAKVTIVSPSGKTYTNELSLGSPSAEGTVSKKFTFPDSAFTPSGETIIAGTYIIKLNSTLATGDFRVNILDSSEYHRGQTMKIKAIGYQANQAATITISGKEEVLDTLSVIADANGKIDTTWVVSTNAPIGEGTVKIAVTGNPKDMSDKQTFTIIGYKVNITITNLAGTPVRDIDVFCLDTLTNLESNQTSNAMGQVVFGLEKGPHTLNAYWNEVNIGSATITITGDGNFTLTCQLTNLKITVKTQDGTAIPFVDLKITYTYQSGTISKTGSETGQTGGNGYYTLTSTLTGAKYTIEASLYDEVFNLGNDTLTIIQNKPVTEATVICPSKIVSMVITGYNDDAITGARIELVELSNGLFYSTISDNAGVATANATFGSYRLRVYKDDALIKETNLKVFDETRRQIKCSLYGVQLSVSVVDLFGSPIQNAHVTLNGAEKTTALTESNGKATFNNIIGGNIQVIAEIQGTPDASQAITLTVDEPTNIEVKLEKYISVGGTLLQANTLITAIIVLVIAVLFIIVEVIRRQKT